MPEELLHEADVVCLVVGGDREGASQVVWPDFGVDSCAVAEFVEVLADGGFGDAWALEAEVAA